MPDYKGTDGRFISVSMHERFWNKVYKTDSCWIFTGRRDTSGYGRMRIGPKMPMAHHISYYLKIGEWLPFDLEPDHTCKNPSCVRWAHGHLEAVSHNEHVKRTALTHRNKIKTVCKYNHDDWKILQNGKRFCNECNRGRYHARKLGISLEEYYA